MRLLAPVRDHQRRVQDLTPEASTRHGADAGYVVGQAFPWLLRQKITVPDRVAGYVHRAELVHRAMPTRRKLTVLKASAGFGKTTMLAECCRRLRRDGVPTAWVSLDERDEAEVLDIYIASACHGAGLDLLNVPHPDPVIEEPVRRVDLVVRGIQTLAGPFVIAFDEAERLRDPASVSLLEFLLQRGPPNLHLAIACRQIPNGLDVAGAVLDSRAEVFTTEQLRFSKSEVARFFNLSLSRRQLAAEIERSLGWPFALQISRNQLERGADGDTGIARDLVENWIESRLFAGLGRDDRDFLLDVGLFDWMDAALLEEVLQRVDSMRRLESMRVLAGLLESVGSGAIEGWRLHPLVRGYCAERRLQENPRRFRVVNRRIAETLMRRGDTVSAVHHAVKGGDPESIGRILEQAGGVRLWVREGFVPIRAADRYMNEGIIATRPRLALVRCLVLLMSRRLDEARTLFREVAVTSAAGAGDGRDTDFEFLVDACIVRGVMALYGAEPIGSDWVRGLSDDYVRLLESRRLDPVTHGHMEYALCVMLQLKAEFDAALEHLARGQQYLAQSRYMSTHAEILRGQVAMAQGRVQDAESHYRSARQMARKNRVLDPMAPVGAEVMLAELALECGRVSSAAELRGVSRVLMATCAPFSGYAGASGPVIELMLRAGRTAQALATADELLEHVRRVGLTALARYLAALRISVLVFAGRVGEAERAWRVEGLPEDSGGCVDLTGQSWREMEVVACARLRWLVASGRFDDGRHLARELRSVAVERCLRRTAMRALALSIVLEQRAGEPVSGVRHLEEFLSLFAESPYAWPLMQERAICEPVVAEFLDRKPDSQYRESARSLLAAIRGVDDVRDLVLSERERAVLVRLADQRDKQIAVALGLTVDGVRYHMRKLFTRLGVRTRADAVRRARELGLIPDDS